MFSYDLGGGHWVFPFPNRNRFLLFPFKVTSFAVQNPFHSQDLISNYPYCLSDNSYNVRFENLVLYHLIIPKLIFVFVFITSVLDIVLILYGEILSW